MRTHDGDRNFKCEECDFYASSERALEQHTAECRAGIKLSSRQALEKQRSQNGDKIKDVSISSKSSPHLKTQFSDLNMFKQN